MRLKIATYNLYEGAEDSYFRLIDFVKEQKFDALCLQEINGWQNDEFAKLKDFTDRSGFTDYVYGNSNSDYKLATLSSLPIKFQTNHQEGFWHCAVETHVEFNGQELVIINVSLDPWKEEPRLRELGKLLGKLDLSKPTIITGSLNSLSRLDGYGPEYFDELQKKGIYKYGQDKLDFEVTDKLAEVGFMDAATKFRQLEPTTPTAYPASTPEPPVRTDYCFVSQDLLPLVAGFEIIKNDETDKISDHYPLILTLDDSASQPEEVAEPAEISEPKVETVVAEELPTEERVPNNNEVQAAENEVNDNADGIVPEDASETEGPKIITNEDATEGEIDLH